MAAVHLGGLASATRNGRSSPYRVGAASGASRRPGIIRPVARFLASKLDQALTALEPRHGPPFAHSGGLLRRLALLPSADAASERSAWSQDRFDILASGQDPPADPADPLHLAPGPVCSARPSRPRLETLPCS
jgi:hypothetical protein